MCVFVVVGFWTVRGFVELEASFTVACIAALNRKLLGRRPVLLVVFFSV